MVPSSSRAGCVALALGGAAATLDRYGWAVGRPCGTAAAVADAGTLLGGIAAPLPAPPPPAALVGPGTLSGVA